MNIVYVTLFALVVIATTGLALLRRRMFWIPIVLGVTATIFMAIFFHSAWFVLWAILISGSFVLIYRAHRWLWRMVLIVLALVMIVGGVIFTSQLIIVPQAAPTAVSYCDPSAIPYGSYALVAGKAITGTAIVEWWDQTPATLDPVTGKLNLAAMKGHEGIQFLMAGETITPAMGLVGSVFPLNSDNDLLCVKNQHLLKFYSKPQHIYATGPEELILLVPTVVLPTK